jgi:hypothetical protein
MRELYQPPAGTQAAIDQATLAHAAEIGALKADMANMKERLEGIDEKLGSLVAAANMGKGAWWLSVKIGGAIVTIMAGLAWLWQHVLTMVPGR